jgi:sugar lactone lactonase YvrE
MIREYTARPEWAANCTLGEGPLWSEAAQQLYFVDIKGRRLHAFEPASGKQRSWELPDMICWLVPCRDGDGFIAGMQRELVRLRTEPALRFEPLGVALDLAPGVRLNDAKADAHGNVWFGSMHNLEPQRPEGRLFRLDPSLALTEVERGIHICNGPAFHADAMFHTDSLLGQVHRYPLSAQAHAGAGQLWRQFDAQAEGSPDGMSFDAEGGLWIAQWGGGRVCRYLPDGRVDAIVRVPVSQPSSCAFGGPDLKTLYITSAREDLTARQLETQPLAGALFSARVDVAGLPAATFG